MMKKSPIISLTGGLGNQLFQLAAGLSFFKETGFAFEWGIGKPRLNSIGEPELTSFELPKNVFFLPKKRFSWLMSKSTGYVLRMGISPRWYEKNSFSKRIIRVLSELVSTIYFREFRHTFYSRNLGYTNDIPEDRSTFVIGYFQSHLYASSPRVKNLLHNLVVHHPHPEIQKYVDLSKEECPLVVHIRLGDYKNEPGFGLLSQRYFNSLMQSELAAGVYGKVWVFSDEPKLASKYLESVDPSRLRVIESTDNSTATTFEIMRLGRGYIISNSSFSWWAAFLAHDSTAKVVAPYPWFKDIEEPEELIPIEWIRVPATWKETNDN